MLVTTKLAALSSIDMFANFWQDIMAKIGEHINGTSGAERGSSVPPTLVSYTRKFPNSVGSCRKLATLEISR